MKHFSTSLRLILFTTLLASACISASAQSSVTIDFKPYTTKTHPYMIPDLPSGSEFYLSIKTGHPVYISIAGMDAKTGYFHGGVNSNTYSNDTIQLVNSDCGSWIVNYKVSGTIKAVGLTINYQADLQDQTIGSATYGNYPDFIWVAQGGSATVSAGPYMNPTGSTTSGYYKWKTLSDAAYTGSYTDSVRFFGKGSFIGRLNDGTGYWTNDTISILEKPTLDIRNRMIVLSSTVTGVTYRTLLANIVSGKDTTWTEGAHYVGDGSGVGFVIGNGSNTGNGIYKLEVERGIHSAVYPYSYFTLDFTSELNKLNDDFLTYHLVGNTLQFNTEVKLRFYSLQGQLLQSGQGTTFMLRSKTGIFTATDKAGNAISRKIY